MRPHVAADMLQHLRRLEERLAETEGRDRPLPHDIGADPRLDPPAVEVLDMAELLEAWP